MYFTANLLHILAISPSKNTLHFLWSRSMITHSYFGTMDRLIGVIKSTCAITLKLNLTNINW